MGDKLLDMMESMAGRRSDYTLEEIEKAEKLKKKHGGSLTENLIKVTGRRPSPVLGSSSLAGLELPDMDISSVMSVPSGAEQLQENSKLLDEQLKELNENLAKDFGVKPAEEVIPPKDPMEAFSGLEEEIAKSVYGQEEMIHKLNIAFKRPFLMPPEEGKARNCIYLSGPEYTGRHSALKELVRLLNERGALKSGSITTVNLGLYTDSSQEKIFLQDMYSALAGENEVILFENYQDAHPSFLTHVADLVIKGSFRLSERYVQQNGQLVGIQNSLATSMVGEVKASGKYLVFISGKGLGKAADVFGAAFVNALLGDACEAKQPDAEVIKRVAERETAELVKTAKDRLSFEIKAGEEFTAHAASKGDRGGIKAVLGYFDSVTQALVQAKLEGDYPSGMELELVADGNKLTGKCEKGDIDLSALMPGAYQGEIEEVKAEMEKIVGLKEIKEYILSLEEYYRVQKRREEEGLKTGSVSKHMIFTGSPGTGKTTIARIISRYLKAIGVLSGGQLVEVSRADLVGKYVGHTAPLTQKVISSALGGVLFIDEAYSLYRGRDDSYGLEAIDTLVKGIEDNRDDLIVILAGYSNEMEEFLTANSGLKSRFPNVINFPDYTGEELLEISKSIAASKGYIIEEEAYGPLTAFFDKTQAEDAAEAGNGRLARNLVEEAILNQSRRLAAEPDAPLDTLKEGDFEL